MTMQATIKNIEPTYSALHDVIRAILSVEETDEAFLAIGKDAEDVAGYAPGTQIEIGACMVVTLTDNRRAVLIDRARAVQAKPELSLAA